MSLNRLLFSQILRSKQSPNLFGIVRMNSTLVPVDTPSNQPEVQPRTEESLEDFPSYFSPTFNFAAYVNKSETLQKFVNLGVDLSKLEMRAAVPYWFLQLDFDRDCKKHLFFLHDLGISAEQYGEFITKNPFIFKESIEDLETRVYYLRSKKFSIEQVRDIVRRNPYWLSFSTKRVDRRLGWYQKNFNLSGDDLRFLTCKQPKLITYNLMNIRSANFTIKEQMGFEKLELKALLLAKPNLWMASQADLLERFDYIHNVMKIPHEKIVQSPEILTSRRHRLKQRHDFLRLIGKLQFDETKPGYISLKSFVEGNDKDFVLNVCKSSLETYDNFLKTL